IGEADAKWSVGAARPPVFPVNQKTVTPPKVKVLPKPLAGSFSSKSGSSTKLTVSKEVNGQFGRVIANVDGLIGEARVRVAPTVPYIQDFEFIPLGGIPGGWVNTQGKFTVVTLPDGSKVLSKRNDLSTPLVARANAFMSLPSTRGYSIEGDIMGTAAGAG